MIHWQKVVSRLSEPHNTQKGPFLFILSHSLRPSIFTQVTEIHFFLLCYLFFSLFVKTQQQSSSLCHTEFFGSLIKLSGNHCESFHNQIVTDIQRMAIEVFENEVQGAIKGVY